MTNKELIDFIHELCARYENTLNIQEKVVDGRRKNNVVRFVLKYYEDTPDDGYDTIQGIILRNDRPVFVADRKYNDPSKEDEMCRLVLMELMHMIFFYGMESANRQLQEIASRKSSSTI
jgi:hypothetical protein